MSNDLLEDMKLPTSNSNEELEDLSSTALRLLFDVKLFEIRPESGRIKG